MEVEHRFNAGDGQRRVLLPASRVSTVLVTSKMLDEDELCDGVEVLGCTDDAACNFNLTTEDNDACLCPIPLYDCLGNCLSTRAGWPATGRIFWYGPGSATTTRTPPLTTRTCRACMPFRDTTAWATASSAAAWSPPPATTTPAPPSKTRICPCLDAVPGYDCLGNCIDLDDNGVCDADEVDGLHLSSAENYDPNATEDNGSCEFPIDPNPTTLS